MCNTGEQFRRVSAIPTLIWAVMVAMALQPMLMPMHKWVNKASVAELAWRWGKLSITAPLEELPRHMHLDFPQLVLPPSVLTGSAGNDVEDVCSGKEAVDVPCQEGTSVEHRDVHPV